MTERDSLVDVPNGSIYTKCWIPETDKRQPILLLHDSLGCVGTWRDFPETLARETSRKVIAYDRLGFGRSTARSELPSPNFIDEETQIVNRLLDHFEAPRAALFGYSVGGSMALSAAAQIPDRIIAVISESAQVFVEDHTLAGIAAARRKFGNPQAVEKLRRWHGDKVEWILRAWFDVWTAPNFRDWSLKPILPNIECPLLVIHGDLDEFGTLAFPETIVQLVGGPTKILILENCGHIPHWEREETVVSETQTLLDPLP